MGKINELIQQYCPDGVEYVNVGDVCDIHKGVQFNKSDMKEMGSYPVMNGGINPSGYAEVFNEDENTITISQGGASAGYVNFLDSKFWLGAHCYALKPYSVVMNRYLYHYIKQSEITLQQCQYGAGIPALAKSTISSLEIPLPPLPVQEAIVNILDRFAVYAAELQAELQARQQQYNYYRDTLLSFEGREDVQWKKLGEVGKVCMCKRILKEQTSLSGDVPFFKIGTFGGKADAYISQELFETYKAKYSYPKKGDILISAAGTIGRTVVFDGCPSYFQDSNIVWLKHDESVVLNSYLKYCYSLNPWAVSTGGTIARLYNDNILNAIIPIPPLSVQQRIVDILDRFDTLVNDLSQGLPAEIEARQQQYEYYRDRLLTFNRK